jgi:lipoprotein NlpI
MEQQAWDKAAAEYEAAAKADHSQWGDYARLHLWVARARQGNKEEADRELIKTLGESWNTSKVGWTAKLGDFLLGRITEADLMKVVASFDSKYQLRLQCEAWYFAGIKRLLAQDSAGAVDCFKKSVAANLPGVRESHASKVELGRMGK